MTVSDEDSYRRPNLTATMSDFPKNLKSNLGWRLIRKRFLPFGKLAYLGGSAGRPTSSCLCHRPSYHLLSCLCPSTALCLSILESPMAVLLISISLAAVPTGAAPVRTTVAPLGLVLTSVALALLA